MLALALGLGLTPSKGGGGVIYDFTIIALGRVIGPNTRFIDTRSA
jgi:hypothetical protein